MTHAGRRRWRARSELVLCPIRERARCRTSDDQASSTVGPGGGGRIGCRCLRGSKIRSPRPPQTTRFAEGKQQSGICKKNMGNYKNFLYSFFSYCSLRDGNTSEKQNLDREMIVPHARLVSWFAISTGRQNKS